MTNSIFTHLGCSRFVQLLIVFPLKAKKGILGVELGSLTPIFVLFFNFVWGITAALWFKISK